MTPTAQPRTRQPIPPIRLTPTDEVMLTTCARYQYMTVAHWCRYYEDPDKDRYLQRRALALSTHNYLTRLYLTPTTGKGKGQNIFTHGTAGRNLAESLGKRVPNRFRPIDAKTVKPLHLAHSNDITDVLLSFDLLARHDERITIPEMLHERFLTEQRFKVPVQFTNALTGELRVEQMEVTPDAFVKVAARIGTKPRYLPIMVECDRDTEEQIAFRRKIAKLYAFGTSEMYRTLYQAKRFNVAFFIQAPVRSPLDRLADVLAWTARELKQRNLEQAAPFFNFCALDPAMTSPEDLLLGANWYHPFSTSPHALIDLSVTTEGGV